MRRGSLSRIFLAAAFAASCACAADYPARPVRMIVPAPPGGTMDILGRILADKLTTALGQSVVVENKPGAGTVIGTDMVAKAVPDGQMIVMIYVAHAINPFVYSNLPYDSEKDFSPIAEIAESPDVVVVTPSLPVNSVADLIAFAKANPGKVNYASAGVGTNSHLSAEMLNNMAGISLVHVPYKGGPPANLDVASGVCQVTIPSLPLTMPLIKANRLKPIAVTGPKRSPALPNVPTVGETLPGYESLAWYGFLAPARTPRSIIDRLSGELEKALKQPDVVQSVAAQGAEVKFMGPEGFAGLISTETVRWGKVVKEIGLKPGNL